MLHKVLIDTDDSERCGAEEWELRWVLTTSTDVLTTSETLCLSSAAVPGLPRPRVNFLVSGCTGVAIATRPLGLITVQSTRFIKFTGNSSSAYPRLRPPLVRTTSLKLGHVVVWPLVRRSYSSIQFSFLKINTCRIAPELCLLLSGIVDTIKCPLE